MSESIRVHHNKPKNWQDFERLVRVVFACVYPGSSFERRGSGKQDGVDVLGRTKDGGWIGIQCKGREASNAKSLSAKQIQDEVAKATGHKPKLDKYIIATVDARNLAIQKAVSEITDEHIRKGMFPVELWDWDTFEEHISEHRKVREAFYGREGSLSLLKASLLIFLLAALGVAGFIAVKHYDFTAQRGAIVGDRSVAALQAFASGIEELEKSYSKCLAELEENTFIFSKAFGHCLATISTNLAKLDSIRADINIGGAAEATEEVDRQIMVFRYDYRELVIHNEMLKHFESDVGRALESLCKDSPLPKDMLRESLEKAADIANEQLATYFVMRDFIFPSYPGFRARIAMVSRSIQGVGLTAGIIKEVGELNSLRLARREYQFSRSSKPFQNARVKAFLAREFKSSDFGDDFVEESLRTEFSYAAPMAAIQQNKAVAQRLVECGVLKEGAPEDINDMEVSVSGIRR